MDPSSRYHTSKLIILKNKEICFISSPGNGLFCCCRQSEVRNPSPTWSGKWNEAADPNLNPMQAVETESIGNSRVGSTSTRRSAKGGKKKKKKKREATVMPCCSATCVNSSSVSIFPTGYIPAHSPTSPTSTLRATRAHDADLLIYPFTVPPWARHRDSRGYFCIQCAYA